MLFNISPTEWGRADNFHHLQQSVSPVRLNIALFCLKIYTGFFNGMTSEEFSYYTDDEGIAC